MSIVLMVVLCLPIITAASAPVRYAVTIHPLAAILEEVVGSRGEVILLLKPGLSPHTFEPRPSDMKAVEKSLALISVGAGLDRQWSAKLSAGIKIELLDLVPASYRLPALYDEDDHHGENEQDDSFTDPHFWTDPLAVKAILPSLVEALAQLDPEGRTIYQENSNRFEAELTLLDKELDEQLRPLSKTPFFLFHPSFQYLFQRYNLNLAGVIERFPGQEPTPRALVKLIKEIRATGARVIFNEPQLPQRPAQIIAEAAGVSVDLLDPVGGETGRMTYAEIIRYNAAALSRAR